MVAITYKRAFNIYKFGKKTLQEYYKWSEHMMNLENHIRQARNAIATKQDMQHPSQIKTMTYLNFQVLIFLIQVKQGPVCLQEG